MGIRCFDAMFEAGEVGCVKIARWFGSSCSGDWNDRWFRNALVVWFLEWGRIRTDVERSKVLVVVRSGIWSWWLEEQRGVEDDASCEAKLA
jgi:hypothetical protein